MMRTKKWIATALAAAALAGFGLASAPAFAGAQEAAAALHQKFPKLPAKLPVRATPFPGLYEVSMLDVEGTGAYTDEKATFLMTGGSLIDSGSLKDYAEQRRLALIKDGIDALPLELALKNVYGKGQRTLVMFEDPDCPFCKKQHQEVFKAQADRVNATVYTFLMPLTRLHPDAGRKSLAILCSADPSKTWRDWMDNGSPLPEKTDCKGGQERLDKMAAEGSWRKFNATPTFMFASGHAWRQGYLNGDQLTEAMGNSDKFLEKLKEQGVEAKAPAAAAKK